MENPHHTLGAVVARNIKIALVDRNLSRNALAAKACIPATTFSRNLDRPEKFSLEHVGGIAEALGVTIPDLFKEAA
jgi:hypothetical protein